MTKPSNPETIILKNEWYPNGLKEKDIWNYYQKNKVPILRETLGRTLMVFFSTDINKTVVLRRNKSGQIIKLNSNDYNEIVSGRTLSFHLIMENYSDYGIIDIDIDNFDLAKSATLDVYDIMIKNKKLIDDVKIIYSGKDSFHLKTYFKNDYPIDYIRNSLNDYLIEKKMNIDYTISSRRTRNIPNLDLGRNYNKAGHICLYSLSVIGLKSVEVEKKRLKNFKKESCKIL